MTDSYLTDHSKHAALSILIETLRTSKDDAVRRFVVMFILFYSMNTPLKTIFREGIMFFERYFFHAVT